MKRHFLIPFVSYGCFALGKKNIRKTSLYRARKNIIASIVFSSRINLKKTIFAKFVKYKRIFSAKKRKKGAAKIKTGKKQSTLLLVKTAMTDILQKYCRAEKIKTFFIKRNFIS